MEPTDHADGAPPSRRRRRTSGTHIAILVAALTLAACGGSDGGDEATDEATPTTATETTAPAEPVGEPTTTEAMEEQGGEEGEEPSSGGEVSMATVSIDGETYRFQNTGFITETCDPSFFGGAQVILFMVDDSGEPVTVESQTKTLSIVLIPEDVDDTPAAVNLGTMDADRDWIADPESLIVEGTGVDSWSIDGNRIEGTATFASTAGEGPVQGTFEVTCVEE